MKIMKKFLSMCNNLTMVTVISFVVIHVLFLTSVTYISYKVFFEFTSEEISETRLTLLNERVEKVSNFINSISDAGVYVALNNDVKQIFSNTQLTSYEAIVEQRELTELLNTLLSFKRNIHSINIYTDRYEEYPTVSGSAVYSSDTPKEEDWFQVINEMDNGWVPNHTSRNGEEIISYIHRLSDNYGNTIGYVKVNVLVSTIIEAMSGGENIHPNKDSYILVDAGERVILQDDGSTEESITNQVVSRQNGTYNKIKPRYADDFNYHNILKEGNLNYLFMISSETYNHWRLVHITPMDVLYEETKKIGWSVMVIGLIGLLFSIPLAIWAGRKLIFPINKMIRGMREVEKGNFHYRLGSHYIEEYNILSKNFNNMAERLEESIKQIDKEHKGKREAEVKALQAQISPHFLYNTLEMVHWRALDYKAEDISYMVNQLSKMFRIGVTGGRKFIPLRDELVHADCYINIQKARFHMDISYTIDIPAAMKRLYVSKIILQPFIENSIKHGFPRMPETRPEIRVTAFYKEDTLKLQIIDNGKGLPEELPAQEASGIGIKNTQERIWLYCGSTFGATLYSRDTQGVIVEITLPIIKTQTEAEDYLNER